MGQSRMVSEREIVGKRISRLRYTLEPHGSSGGGALHLDVCLDLDDGSTLYFVGEESEGGDSMGVFVGRIRQAKASGGEGRNR